MNLRYFVRCGVAAVMLLLVVGCTDPMLGLGDEMHEPGVGEPARASWQPQRQTRASKQNRKTADVSQPPGIGDIYMLYLVRDPSVVPTGQYIHATVLRRAKPAQAVWLMDWLTEPAGQGGSADRQFLVYSDSGVFEWAADVAGLVDIRAAASRPAAAASSLDGFAQAVAALYAAGRSTQVSQPEARGLMKQLESYGSAPGDPHRRWAAFVLAGRLSEDVLGNRRDAAVAYDRAGSLVQPSSPAWLVARYRQANALYISGNKSQARQIAQNIVDQAGQRYGKVRAYRQAAKLAAGTR